MVRKCSNFDAQREVHPSKPTQADCRKMHTPKSSHHQCIHCSYQLEEIIGSPSGHNAPLCMTFATFLTCFSPSSLGFRIHKHRKACSGSLCFSCRCEGATDLQTPTRIACFGGVSRLADFRLMSQAEILATGCSSAISGVYDSVNWRCVVKF